MSRVGVYLCTCALLAAWAVSSRAQPTEAPESARTFLWQTGMTPSEIGEVNVFRRFSSDRTEAMRTFYGSVLALPVLPETALGGGQMIRYPLGESEVKLFPVAPSEAESAGLNEAVGVRLLTFFYSDREALERRFAEHGYPQPEFREHAAGAGAAHALIQDPAGEWVELVIVPDARPEALERFEIGITAADLDASRAFYRDFLGFEELSPVQDALLGTAKHGYRHRGTTINLWSFGDSLPKDTETAGMQYIVWNVTGVNALAESRGVPIDRPLSAPGQMRTVWLTDPDGISNYFAEFAGNDNTPPLRGTNRPQ